jgi:carboxypeptidase Taq
VTADATWEALAQRVREQAELRHAMALLSWDRQTTMPPAGIEARARTTSTVAVLRHRRLIDPEMGELLDQAASGPLDPHQAAVVKLTRRDRDQALRLPPDLVRRLGLAATRGNAAWHVAREQRDFTVFQPHLEEMVGLKREQADLIGYEGERYDALLDDYEPGMRTAQVEPMFAGLTKELVELLGQILAAPARPAPPFAGRIFGDDDQMRFSQRLLPDLGFDVVNAGRLDRSAHPFSTAIALGDVRITTRMYEHDPFPCVLATIHEAGHGMYEQGMDPEYEDLPVSSPPSLGLHESQSRLWENIVGRSRGFWQHYTPIMAEYMGESLAGTSAEDAYRHVNHVEPSFIRVDADEVTYNLHVLIRFELELALMRDQLEVADLPGMWNDAYERRLGIRPAHDADGVLQDTHWSGGAFGYFPTYTLGTIYSAMLWDRITVDLPDIDSQVAAAEFGPLLGWLRAHVHHQGSLYDGAELIQRVTGSELDHRPLMRYLWGKFGPLYGLEGA